MGTYLDTIDDPADLKRLFPRELDELAVEIRQELVKTTTENGGHLASNLGVVELTIALHRVFDSPQDKIVWDVSHQCYVHKLVTGRRQKFSTIRKMDGLCGFTMREESPHDPFGAGHASTSISAALGIARGRDLMGGSENVVAVIGDGAMTGGMAFEAMNHAGQLGTRLIVVLNDNEMSISPNVGAMSKYLSRLRADRGYRRAKADVESVMRRWQLGRAVLPGLKRIKSAIKGLFIPTMIWEELGFTYLGPVDGHDIPLLMDTLERAKSIEWPVFVHVLTVKGKGYAPAEEAPTAYHGVSPTGAKKPAAPTYTKIFGQTLLRIAKEDSRVVGITAAMSDGTGLNEFAAQFPQRVFDVGIAEEHAVTFAAGLAIRGLRPVVAIYSTFMQRAYDQVIHDVCIQHLPVVFAIDRAGIVGDDGRTHQGMFDIGFMRGVPDMVVMAPKDENELQHMLYTALQLNGPVAFRYPRGTAVGVPLDPDLRCLDIGKAEWLRSGKDVAILAFGSMVQPSVVAAELLQKQGIEAAVVNARFAKPLDRNMIVELAEHFSLLVTVEEGSVVGGFGSAVGELLSAQGLFGVTLKSLGLPDQFIEQGEPGALRDRYGLSARGIADQIAHEHTNVLGSGLSSLAG